MTDTDQTMKCAAILQVIASEMSGGGTASVSAREHARTLFRIAADLIVESTGARQMAANRYQPERL